MIMDDHTKHVIDAAAVATTLGTIMSWLPAIAASVSITWTCLRIIEMITGKPINSLLIRKKDATNQEGNKN